MTIGKAIVALLLLMRSLFASVHISIILIVIYAFCIGSATFVERDFGTVVAHDVIYKSWWFSLLNVWILVNVLGCMILSALRGSFKVGFQVLHMSFVVIILGASITRIYGYEGVMQIENGHTSSFMLTSDNHLNLFVNDGDVFDPLGAFKKAYSFRLSPYTRTKARIRDEVFGKTLLITSLSTINYSLQHAINDDDFRSKRKENLYLTNIQVSYGDEVKIVHLFNNGQRIQFMLGGRVFVLSWGGRQIKLPFAIRLDKFEVETYYGSNIPSSYASFVEVISDDLKEPLRYKIYMNHTLDYGGYRFFQSSYTTSSDLVDGKNKVTYTGTVLSVNNDPGKIPTYIGYSLLIVGSILVVFGRNSRFARLSSFIKTQKILSLMLLFVPYGVYADILDSEQRQRILEIMQNTNKRWGSLNALMNENTDEALKRRLSGLRSISQEHLESFRRLQIQYGGRVQTLDTFSRELMRKVTKKHHFHGLNPATFLLGLMVIPRDMARLRFIHVQNKEILKMLGIERGRYISVNDVFDLDGLSDGSDLITSYKLYSFVDSASRKKDSDKDKFDKDVLKLNEQVNYVFPDSIWYYLKIFPDSNDEFWKPSSHILTEARSNNDVVISSLHAFLVNEFLMGITQGDYSNLTFVLDAFHKYQTGNAGPVLLSDRHVNMELFLNDMDVFPISQYVYLFLGIVSFITAIVAIVTNKRIHKSLNYVFCVAFLGVFVLHTIGLLLRWYIGGHAPWSNAYESMLYISWTSALSGLVMSRHSYLALCGASFISSMALTVAHLGFMDPQIGNLVPVLRSYWLNIHVSVIIASYGFLGLSFTLGVISLTLFLFSGSRRPHVRRSIICITVINEMSMIIGLLMLTIGTFLGGVWANESWGRYWSWDSKETWSLVSIGVYACVLHVRLLGFRHYPYYFSALSVIAFSCILMTYFGVNYYLSGMHSYARGDEHILGPGFYIPLGTVVLLILVSFFRRRIDMPPV